MMEINYGRIRVSSALTAEAWTIRVACAMAASSGIHDFIIESDSLKAISMVNGKRAMEMGSPNLFRRCKDFSS